jgi:hypothetical protein
MQKRKQPELPDPAQPTFAFLDFSTFKRGSPSVIFEAGKTASELMENDDFFKGTVGVVLTEIATAAHLPLPTEAEVSQVKEQLKNCKARCFETEDAYMQCSVDDHEIIVGGAVKLNDA